MRRYPTALALAVSATALIACGGAGQATPDAPGPGRTNETRPANGQGQTPAFPGQTRAPALAATPVTLTTVVEGLEHPWGLAQMPDGPWLVTERPGRLRIVGTDGTLVEAPVTGLPTVDARGQGGLFDIALSPGFATDRMIYWSYAEPREGGNATSVARGRLSDDAGSVTGAQVIFRAQPTYDGDKHFGGRLVFDRQGHLFITLGERSDKPMRPQAQDLASDMGKVIRLNADGSVPSDNPFARQDGARPEIWSLGHRNVQGTAIDPATGDLWTIEHGTRGGDEVNHDQAGVNYGWPIIAYGIEYAGGPINEGVTARRGLEQPVYYWDPVIAPGGATFYDGALFAGWRGNLLVAGLSTKRISRLVIENGRVMGEEYLIPDIGQRVRQVAVGHDGAIYAVTDEAKGRLVRVTPR